MYNYFVAYNLFKKNKRIASGDAFVESSKKILSNEEFLEIKRKLEEQCKETCNFTFLQVLSLTYLGQNRDF